MNKNFVRSDESIAFEQMWLHIPSKGIIPDRKEFHPRMAKRFLRHLILAQIPSAEDPAIRIRLVGDAIRQQVQGEMTNLNYLDFLGEDNRRTEAISRVRESFDRPCGHWWVVPVHYRHQFSQYWEITTFPLAAIESEPAMVLALVRPFDSLADRGRAGRTVVSVDTPVQFEVIDIRQ